MPGTRRQRTTIEAAAKDDLQALPPMYRCSAVAAAYLMAARRLDMGVATREMPPVMRELRQCWLALMDLAPAKQADDPADELAARRTQRMEAAGRG